MIVAAIAIAAISLGCSGSSDGETPAASSGSAETGPSEWRLLPQFPPREQVISRRLLGLNDLFALDDNTAWVVGTDGAYWKDHRRAARRSYCRSPGRPST